MEVRVRFAPSPTGALHIGGVRTALYNYLLARKHKGTMILRIEDTDQNRFVPGAEEYIIESLKWVGITIDEGVGAGGPYAPYRQSERKAIYMQYAKQLLESGDAYYAFDTSEELDAQRKANNAFQYDGNTRTQLNNSLTLPADKVQEILSKGTPYVIRFKVPADTEVKINDLLRGEVVFSSAQVDDKVLMKSDGMPTYHLANVVDDHLMKISHVIRGEEWLPSAPLHVLLYRALGWEGIMPKFSHLPLLLKPDGNGKLSKRDADKMGFPIFPLTWKDPATGEVATGYREAGYLPEAIINFLAFLGWNPGTEQEIFSMDELVEAFTMERIGKAGAKFDILKAQWFNQQYIRKNTPAMVDPLLARLKSESIDCTKEKAEKIVEVLKDRVTFPADFFEQGKFFFAAPLKYDEAINKKWTAATEMFMSKLAELLQNGATNFKTAIEDAATAAGVKSGQMMQALRISITGGTAGPDLTASMEILGTAEVARRIDTAVATLKIRVA
ncbi:MAG TPA: glutamate--tRNA ligase [Cyclobacteriaceae bacterium]|nr:glutamate--tRNA ligase [Cyclobacteriaceae bacterium]